MCNSRVDPDGAFLHPLDTMLRYHDRNYLEPGLEFNLCLNNFTYILFVFHYDNTPIQIYGKFYNQKRKIFR